MEIQRGFCDLFGNRSVDSRNLRLATANTPGYYSHLAKVMMRKIRIISKEMRKMRIIS